MSRVTSIGSYLPPWQVKGHRVKGVDEDAITMAVAAGRAADAAAVAKRLVVVSRDFPLLEGGNGAVLLAGLGLSASLPVTEVLGGGPAALDQVASASPNTLIIATDDNVASVGAVAVLVTDTGAGVDVLPTARQTRSLPLHTRDGDGTRHEYVDPRLEREVGLRATARRLQLADSDPLLAVAGATAAQLEGIVDTAGAIHATATSAAAALRLLAEAVERKVLGLLVSFEQSEITAVSLRAGDGQPPVVRDEVPPRELPEVRVAEGVGIPISLPAYARAFEPKIRWEAAVFDERPGIDSVPQFPPRARVDDYGVLAADYRLEPLPRTGAVYTHTTVRIPVPDLPSPYSLAVIQLDNSPVRVLLKVTGVPAGETTIGQRGAVVLRRIAMRSGIPDYGYAFWPGRGPGPGDLDQSREGALA
ncbi:Zn-ribbon domain-containing OB-fold protein [Mycobacterium vicinigordonae]|uniref:OB-fold domain-containing protein n=1 Tax=Mycobacterium vicinigordonae TaxID=1719132 RepID=A0A7D6E3Y8_9MYCO|nr:OB-fold domain-containing protein [Mycobacterium vicinigordonae]QLL09101.1 OB-fold domain-containing protein [Mycobacterium vicinigordonae]